MKNKKGVFYTFIAILLASLILFSFTTETNYRLKEKMGVIETRINTLNSFFNDVEKDLSRGLYISGFRAFLAMNEYIGTNGRYINDTSKRFEEAILNGTVDSVSIDVLQNQTFLVWANKISKEALKIGINANISIINLSLFLNDPWSVGVTAYVDIRVNDTKESVSLSKIKNISTSIGIIGFDDPLYTINSNGLVFNPILKTNVTNFGDITQLMWHLNNSFYRESNSSPDFLMRLEGNLSNSTYGIESIVNVNAFTLQGLPVKIRSNVDYIYFGEDTLTICQVNETRNNATFNWFRIDDGHLAKYSVHCVS